MIGFSEPNWNRLNSAPVLLDNNYIGLSLHDLYLASDCSDNYELMQEFLEMLDDPESEDPPISREHIMDQIELTDSQFPESIHEDYPNYSLVYAGPEIPM